MSNQLESLTIREISLVDNPANSEVVDGKKIQRAKIALFKRDATVTTDRVSNKSKEIKKMKLKEILKSDNPTRDQITTAVERKAEKIAKREGIHVDVARGRLWANHPEAVEAYERAPIAKAAKPEPKMCRATVAEGEMDDAARKLMKKNPKLSYAIACQKVLESNPGLYDKYERQKAAGATHNVPEVPELGGTGGYSDDDEDDDE